MIKSLKKLGVDNPFCTKSYQSRAKNEISENSMICAISDCVAPRRRQAMSRPGKHCRAGLVSSLHDKATAQTCTQTPMPQNLNEMLPPEGWCAFTLAGAEKQSPDILIRMIAG